MFKKLVATTLLIFILMVTFVGSASAGGVGDWYDDWKDRRISDAVGDGADGDTTEILQEVDRQVSNAIAALRVVAVIAAVIFIVWIGIIFFFSGGQPQKVAQAKTQIVFFFVAMACIFMAEPIIHFVLSWFPSFFGGGN